MMRPWVGKLIYLFKKDSLFGCDGMHIDISYISIQLKLNIFVTI